MKKLLFHCKEMFFGKSVVRTFLNYRLYQELLKGTILDLGSGGADFYSKKIPLAPDATYNLVDLKKGQKVDFETDPLPYETGSFDTVLLLNVLEHIYNHKHLLKEARRIKKEGGVLIGFVPFLMWYHADHKDFFRYTHDALDKILPETGYIDYKIEKLYWGPYTTGFQMIHTTLPKFLRPFVFAAAYLIDSIFRKIRSKGAERYVIGYYFTAT